MNDTKLITGTEVRRGRPVGTEESPETLLRKELIAHLKIYRRCREMVQTKIEAAAESLDADTLAKFMDLLRRGIVDMAKPIVAPAKAETAPKIETEDPEKILASLLAGEK